MATAGNQYIICTHWPPWIVCRLSSGRGSEFGRYAGLVRRLSTCHVMRAVSIEYLYCRYVCIIENTGFIMNKHTYIVSWSHEQYISAEVDIV